jgi:hypothetical protein
MITKLDKRYGPRFGNEYWPNGKPKHFGPRKQSSHEPESDFPVPMNRYEEGIVAHMKVATLELKGVTLELRNLYIRMILLFLIQRKLLLMKWTKCCPLWRTHLPL